MMDSSDQHISLTLIWRFVLEPELVTAAELEHLGKCDKCLQRWWQTKVEVRQSEGDMPIRLK